MELAEKEEFYDCGCGLPHGYTLPTIAPDLLSGGLSKLLPTGLRALVLTTNPRTRREVSRLYRTESPDSLLFPQGANGGESGDLTGITGRDFAQILSRAKLPEDIRLVISEGQYVALGKFAAQKLGQKHIIFGGGNLSGHDFVYDGKYSLAALGTAEAVVTDAEDIDLPHGFAFVLCGYLALFDWDISSLLFSGRMCNHVFKEAQTIVSRLMNAVKMFSRRSIILKKAVLTAQLKMSALVETAGAQLLLSGASQAAAALSMLCRHEDRRLLDFFDTTFLLCGVVARAYAAFLDAPIPFAFPPDNNLRAARLCDYLGLNQLAAYRLLQKYSDIKALQLADYRLSVYRGELLRHIYGVIKVLDNALPVYFRLHDDDGFSLKGHIDSLDCSLALGLGSDVLHGETLLSFMRAKGVLDKFIL